MVRGVLFSVALSILLVFAVYRLQSVYQEGLPERVTRIDISSDRIDYRVSSYKTPTQVAIALKAAQDPPRLVAVHECGLNETLEAVLGILREQGYTSFEIQLPDNC